MKEILEAATTKSKKIVWSLWKTIDTGEGMIFEDMTDGCPPTIYLRIPMNLVKNKYKANHTNVHYRKIAEYQSQRKIVMIE